MLLKKLPLLSGVVKWEEPCIVTGSVGVLSASLLALGDKIGESCHCPGPLLCLYSEEDTVVQCLGELRRSVQC